MISEERVGRAADLTTKSRDSSHGSSGTDNETRFLIYIYGGGVVWQLSSSIGTSESKFFEVSQTGVYLQFIKNRTQTRVYRIVIH